MEIGSAWLLGESFSSLVAWAILQRFRPDARAATASTRDQGSIRGGTPAFEPLGLILVGGFVRHPWPWGVRLAHVISRNIPAWILKRACLCYCHVAGRRYRRWPDVQADLQEFVERRTIPADRSAINSRYRLIAESDFRLVAQQSDLPVFQLSGVLDPIVPWPPVRNWLRQHCPSYRETHIVRRAGHVVLFDAPQESADQIVRWIRDRQNGPSDLRPGGRDRSPVSDGASRLGGT